MTIENNAAVSPLSAIAADRVAYLAKASELTLAGMAQQFNLIVASANEDSRTVGHGFKEKKRFESKEHGRTSLTLLVTAIDSLMERNAFILEGDSDLPEVVLSPADIAADEAADLAADIEAEMAENETDENLIGDDSLISSDPEMTSEEAMSEFAADADSAADQTKNDTVGWAAATLEVIENLDRAQTDLSEAMSDLALETKVASDLAAAVEEEEVLSASAIGSDHGLSESLDFALSAGYASDSEADVETAAPKTSEAAKTRGRQAFHSGKFLYLSLKTLSKGNTRRYGSFGWKSMQVIILDPGLTFEEYISRGGRSKDLLWDIEYGNALVEDVRRD